MNDLIYNKLKRLETANIRPQNLQKRLKVYYGWSKINKIQKKEAISIAWRTRRGKTMEIYYEREQTDKEMLDASLYNRVFAVYYIFLDDKQIGGSLKKALLINAEKDKNHVGIEERKKIAEALRSAFLHSHPAYKDPGAQLELDF